MISSLLHSIIFMNRVWYISNTLTVCHTAASEQQLTSQREDRLCSQRPHSLSFSVHMCLVFKNKSAVQLWWKTNYFDLLVQFKLQLDFGFNYFVLLSCHSTVKVIVCLFLSCTHVHIRKVRKYVIHIFDQEIKKSISSCFHQQFLMCILKYCIRKSWLKQQNLKTSF